MLTAAASHTQLTLGIPGFTYPDLYSPARLRDLFDCWHDELRDADLKKRPVDDPELIAVRNDLAALEEWVVARKGELGKKWLSYKFAPPTPDALNLVELRRPSETRREMVVGPPEHRRRRDGFR